MIVVWSVVGLLLLCLVGFIVVTRVGKPHTRKLSELQTHIDRRNRAAGGATAPPTAPTVDKTSKNTGNQEKKRWWAEYTLSVFLVIGAIILVHWGLTTQMRASEMSRWIWDHWFVLLVIWVFGLAILAINKEEKWFKGGVAKIFQIFLTVVMLLAFVVIPVGAKIAAPSAGSSQRVVSQQPASVDGVVHPLSAIPENSDSDHVVPPVGYATNFGGPVGFTIHCVYRGQTGGPDADRTAPCPSGDMVYVYLHNNTTNILEGVTYEFVRPSE